MSEFFKPGDVLRRVSNDPFEGVHPGDTVVLHYIINPSYFAAEGKNGAHAFRSYEYAGKKERKKSGFGKWISSHG